MLCLQSVRKVQANILNVRSHDTWTYECLSLASTPCSVNIDKFNFNVVFHGFVSLLVLNSCTFHLYGRTLVHVGRVT